MDIIKAKAETLATKLNKIAKHIEDQCNDVDLMEVKANDVVEYASSKLPSLEDRIDVAMMMSDFEYVRRVLKENTECARAMLEHVSSSMLDEDDNVTPGMITAFSELNKSIAENMKLYVSSYKDLTTSLANIESKPNNVTNNLNIINNDKNISSVKDMIERLRGKNDL